VLNRAAELLTENMSQLAKIESLTTGRYVDGEMLLSKLLFFFFFFFSHK
jgi:hypothetical protein